MVFNYFQINPLEISNSDLDKYEKILGKSLNDEDREAILKFTGFRRIFATRTRHTLKGSRLTDKA
ncbi:LIMLP_19325 family protein [Leptospira alexanderi]|uniref:LIMLP_19325 family protein n=1 Tax=Leptospira alexanderi TaxID=100053 RepID=UPI00099108A9